MKRFSLICQLVLLSCAAAFAQTVWTDAREFPLSGQISDNTETPYARLPLELKGVSRPDVWNLGQNSAGLFIRFRSNSTSIHARWTALGKIGMNHMTRTGVRGLDLYALDNGRWLFVRSGRPSVNAYTETVISSNMTPEYREYMLYLSLYDGITSLEIGVDEGSVIEAPAVDSPKKDKSIVMYGTSILQGGCATRPGMAFTNIISRRLDRVVYNLGFSGNAHLDYEIAHLMASVEDPGLFYLDYVPNSSVQEIEEKGEAFFNILREKHPDVPVIFVEDPPYTHMRFDTAIREEVEQKNAAQKALFKKLKAQKVKNIYYIVSEGMLGDDLEATVDGVHFTDLGMMRYTDHVLPVIRKALK